MPSKRPEPAIIARRPPRPEFRIVAIGASAGGLEACTKLISAISAQTGPGEAGPVEAEMAFILVQHLDPHHESLMAGLLAEHTSMTVEQAADGAVIAPGHMYVIPPGHYLSVGAGKRHLSKPKVRHGARLPFDFLLHSMAKDCPMRTIGVILSGTGSDGSLGLSALRDAGGYSISQQPEEAEYHGMPSAAIAAGAVDLILPIAKIAAALAGPAMQAGQWEKAPEANGECLPEIIALLRLSSRHDFTLYKMGTLQRRIERRISLAGLKTMPDYLERLRSNPVELDLLAKDLLINVTSFFRDAAVFEMLAAKIVPGMVRDQPPGVPLRIWIAGCSTGEEAYSLAMLFRESIIASKRDIKLQVFASDVDADAIAAARDGVYPETIAADISAERLARFFVREECGYRVSPELRTAVVFTVQDVLADPPFSRLDMISCRNLLIYLGPEAQAKVVALFHFALREGGTLLLGNAETIGNNETRFSVISKVERLYRQIGRSKPGDIGFQIGQAEASKNTGRNAQGQITHQNKLADLVQRLVIEAHCPAAVLINRKQECLFSAGPTDRYLRVAPGHPSHDILAMAPQALRTKLRSAIQQAIQASGPIVVTGGRSDQAGSPVAFDIHVQPVDGEGEPLLLICFVDVPMSKARKGRAASPKNAARVAELEHELETTRTELQGAIHNLEISGEEQRAINEEALSVNEEFQSTNEELLTSKEELQSLNEELTALNSQLQETLDRQKITSNDLQNVLYSTDVATLFLDAHLNIRFFTPATTALFNLIASDIGRPLDDLKSLSSDDALTADAHSVLRNHAALDREIETTAGSYFVRRILPYRADNDKVEGVVITFTDISERKQIKKELEDAMQLADRANMAKSRFLAAASHDLRQPLQTLSLLQGLLAKSVEGPRAKQLVARVDDTLGAMSGMLNTLLDINQIEAGTVRAEISNFPVGNLIERLCHEFAYHADAKHLSLRMVPCSLWVSSDERMLEQILRNLISNAIKYTARGKILVGCRRRNDQISIEIWDSGVGIGASDLQIIFDEYHQVDNVARERSRGLGLGLSIVKRLGNLLEHAVHVRSVPGKGSVFSVDAKTVPDHSGSAEIAAINATAAQHRAGHIFIIEDDPEVRDLLEIMLRDHGHRVTWAHNGAAAVKLVHQGKIDPDLILSDYNLPGGMNGVEVTAKLRDEIGHTVPVIILTGDISTAALRHIAAHDCQQLNKPVKPKILLRAITRMILGPAVADESTSDEARRTAVQAMASLTGRQHQIMDLVLAGHPSKKIAADLGISQRTVENHRAAIMTKTMAKSLPALARMALAAKSE